MSFLQSMAGALAGGDGTHANVLQEIGGLLGGDSPIGGLQGMVAAFEQNGLGGVVASWIGTGQNLPVSAEQIQAVLGNEQVQAMAKRLGLPVDQIASHLSQLLPQVVDKMTPGGAIPEGDTGGLGGLSGMLGGLTR